jgi:integrase
MGLYKLCQHKHRARDRCEHPWWGSFQYKGRLYRESLCRWADQTIVSKAEANGVFDRMRDAIRAGKFQQQEKSAELTFSHCVDLYVERYIKLRSLRSGDEMQQRLALLKERWKGRRLVDVRVGEIEDLIQDLKARGKKPATVNRYLALLRHMMNWAVGREYLERTPFRRGSQALIKFERENNRRLRRLNREEEERLLAAANPLVNMLTVAALDTGMRKGELLKLRFGDIDWKEQVIHVRPENAKSKKGRVVPIGTTRLRSLLDWLRMDANKKPKPDDVPVFSRGDDEALKSFRTAWELAREKANLPDLRFHDLRSEYASRLVEWGVPLSQVRDLLGHSSIVVTERYDRQVLDNLREAVGRLDDGQPFKNLSTFADQLTPVESLSSTH